MSLTSKPRTKRTPHNKSDGARSAETRGERTWTKWRLSDLVDQVLRHNVRDVTAQDMRDVKNLEYLKVKLLVPTAKHHTGLRLPDPVTLKQDQYFGLNTEFAATLDAHTVAKWRANPPTLDELDDAVENLTGRKYYRERKN